MTPDVLTLAQRVTAGRCAVAVTRIGEARVLDLSGVERAAIQPAVPLRQAEFAAGRSAARQAMGLSDQPLPMGADRAPIWPTGWIGSISHSAGWAIAAASRTLDLLGVDLEEDSDLPKDILDTVLIPVERHRLRDLREARRIFAVKEAVYKAQYPRTRQVFGFEMFEVRLTQDRFEAEFQADVGPFRRGERLVGNWGAANGLFLAVALR